MVRCINCKRISLKKGLYYCEKDVLEDFDVFANDKDCDLYKPKRKFKKDNYDKSEQKR